MDRSSPEPRGELGEMQGRTELVPMWFGTHDVVLPLDAWQSLWGALGICNSGSRSSETPGQSLQAVEKLFIYSVQENGHSQEEP